jgi:hypothetical protein
MIQVTVGNNLNRQKVVVDENTATPRKVLEENEIEYAAATIHMDGCSLKPGDLDKTFADLGVTTQTYLLAVVKTENA